MFASEILQILQYLRESNPEMEIRFHTNGSARNAEWWSTLATLVDACIFGVDGLEDTNAIYRRGARWDAVVGNISTFVRSGGRAEWQFLVFQHNEHQVEEARQLSRKLGVARFFVKRTSRFFKHGQLLSTTPIRSAKGDLVGELASPSREQFRNSEADVLAAHCRTPEDYDAYLAETPISCKAVSGRSIYVSAEGLVFPCCWLGGIQSAERSERIVEIHRLIQKLPGGQAALDGRLQPVRSIVESDFFRQLPALWNVGADDRLKMCAFQCGSHDVKRSQWAPNL